MTPTESSPDESLVKALMESRSTLLFTGAGISTASGIPDYRGPKGVWKSRTPVLYHDFLHDADARKRYWQMKSEDVAASRQVSPNETHLAVNRWNHTGRLRCVITQNVDGLHTQAGLPPERVVEIHGSNERVECQSCGALEDAAPFYERFMESMEPETCSCGGWWKPATISFGQSLREEDLMRAQDALLDADLVIALGTSLSVQPAASFPLAAARAGVPYFILNDGVTEHDHHPLVSGRIEGPVEATFPAAIDATMLMLGE